AGRRATAARRSGFGSFAGRSGYQRRSYGPGWALVGDAGYWKDPISAHGLTDALRAADLLAWAILGARGGRAEEQAALRGYQSTRDELSADLFAGTDVIAGQGWTEEEIPGLLMRLSTAGAQEAGAMAALGGRAPADRSVAA